MVIIFILVVLWGVVLTPGIVRRVRGRGSHQSIDSFHHSLELLEHSGPKTIEPAYRLSSGHSNVAYATEAVRTAAPDVAVRLRPQLVLLGPSGQRGEGPMENVDEEWIDHDRYVDDRYIPERNVMASFGGTSPSPTYGQRMAARRRRTVLVVLAGTVVVSALGGFVASVLWGLTIIAVIALVLYVGLMSWMATHQGQLWNDSNERHVARGVSEHRSTMADPYSNDDDQGFARDLWDDESDRIPREAHEDDVWWDEPRRAASR